MIDKHPRGMRGRARIRRNRWDNWSGYIGRRRVWEIGAREDEAREWLRVQEALQLAQRKPTRRDLLRTLAEVQSLAGAALGAAQNDRAPDRADRIAAPLERAIALCIAARAADPPEHAA